MGVNSDWMSGWDLESKLNWKKAFGFYLFCLFLLPLGVNVFSWLITLPIMFFRDTKGDFLSAINNSQLYYVLNHIGYGLFILFVAFFLVKNKKFYVNYLYIFIAFSSPVLYCYSVLFMDYLGWDFYVKSIFFVPLPLVFLMTRKPINLVDYYVLKSKS